MNGIEPRVQKPIRPLLIFYKGRGKGKITANEYGIPFGGDENVVKLDCDDGSTTLNILKATDLYTLNG